MNRSDEEEMRINRVMGNAMFFVAMVLAVLACLMLGGLHKTAIGFLLSISAVLFFLTYCRKRPEQTPTPTEPNQ